MMIILNSKTKSKKASLMWEIAFRIIEKTGFDISLHKCKNREEIEKLLKDFPSEDLTKFRGIIAVGGDGTLNCIVNTILKRDDYENLKEIVFGILPAGFSNSVIWNICHLSKEACHLENCAFILAKS